MTDNREKVTKRGNVRLSFVSENGVIRYGYYFLLTPPQLVLLYFKIDRIKKALEVQRSDFLENYFASSTGGGAPKRLWAFLSSP